MRWEDFLRDEGVPFLCRLLEVLVFSILDDDLLGDFSVEILRRLAGDLVSLRGDLDLFRSEDLSGDGLLDALFFSNDGDTLLFRELEECLLLVSFLLSCGEVFLLGDLLFDFKSFCLFFAECLRLTDLLLER